MKISLNKKTITISDGVTVDIVPASVGDYQKLMGYFVGFSGSDNDKDEANKKILEKLKLLITNLMNEKLEIKLVIPTIK